ncbi:hypothetical protein ACHWQZ_G014640 [Mnemiopsis leidyi]
MAAVPSRRWTTSTKPTMIVSPKPKLGPLPEPSKPEIPLKPKSQLSPKPVPPVKPKEVLTKPVISPPTSPKPAVPTKPLSPGSSPLKQTPKPNVPLQETLETPDSITTTTNTPTPTVMRRQKDEDLEKREKIRRRYSLAVMTHVTVPQALASSSHDLRKDIEKRGEDIWNTYYRERPGYPTLFPAAPLLPSQLRDKTTPHNEDTESRYRAGSKLHRALAELSEDILVLQGFEFTQQEFGLYMSQSIESEKKDNEIGGGCDFMAISDNYVTIFDVRSLSLDNADASDRFFQNIQESGELKAKVSKLARRIVIKTFRFKMPAVRQFTVFPNVPKSECKKLPQFTTLSDAEQNSLVFSEDIDNFTAWWTAQSKAEKGKKDKEFHVAVQRVKQTFIGIWSMDRNHVSESGLCDLSKILQSVEAQMKGGATIEIEEIVSAVNELAGKGSTPEVNGRETHPLLHGVKPVFHLVTRNVGPDSTAFTSTFNNILERETRNLADVDPSKITLVNLNDVNSSGCDTLNKIVCKHADDSKVGTVSYEDALKSDWTAMVCILDLTAACRLSAMKAGSYVDLDTVLLRLKNILSKVKIYFSLVLVVGASEVQGDQSFAEFGNETINKDNRAYFQRTKKGLSDLIQTLVPRSCVNVYDTSLSSTPARLTWPDIKKKLDSLLVFPNKKINKEAIISVTLQIANIENHVLSIASKVNTQKSATKNWIDKLGPGCRNDDLKRVSNTIDKLQEGISEMMELHGKLTTQLCELSRSYQEVYQDVQANID